MLVMLFYRFVDLCSFVHRSCLMRFDWTPNCRKLQPITSVKWRPAVIMTLKTNEHCWRHLQRTWDSWNQLNYFVRPLLRNRAYDDILNRFRTNRFVISIVFLRVTRRKGLLAVSYTHLKYRWPMHNKEQTSKAFLVHGDSISQWHSYLLRFVPQFCIFFMWII